MAAYIWRANPKYWSSAKALEDYISHASGYVYWSTPQHRSKIAVGDQAYIWLSGKAGSGVIATGLVEETPGEFNSRSKGGFKHPSRLAPAGWQEQDAPSPWKTGIRIASFHWHQPLRSPKPNGRQTVELVRPLS